jgi:hypothetical protein
MRNQEPRPFEDLPEEETVETSGWTDNISMPPIVGKIVGGVAAIALLAALWQMLEPLSWFDAATQPSDVTVSIHGGPVEKLLPGAKVVMGSVEVGEVTATDVQGGLPSADIRIVGTYAQQIPHTSQFEVTSLNEYMPGNVGIQVHAPMNPSSAASIADGAHIRVMETPLPPEVPAKFFVVLGIGLVGVVVVLALAKLFKSELMILAGVLLLIAALLFLSGMITVP